MRRSQGIAEQHRHLRVIDTWTGNDRELFPRAITATQSSASRALKSRNPMTVGVSRPQHVYKHRPGSQLDWLFRLDLHKVGTVNEQAGPRQFGSRRASPVADALDPHRRLVLRSLCGG
jgi:hypothetical protein